MAQLTNIVFVSFLQNIVHGLVFFLHRQELLRLISWDCSILCLVNSLVWRQEPSLGLHSSHRMRCIDLMYKWQYLSVTCRWWTAAWSCSLHSCLLSLHCWRAGTARRTARAHLTVGARTEKLPTPAINTEVGRSAARPARRWQIVFSSRIKHERSTNSIQSATPDRIIGWMRISPSHCSDY